MISALAVVLAGSSMVADRPLPALIRRGGDPARGILVNRSPGVRPFDPPNPGRSTVVFVHGCNPLPHVVHFEMAERLAESLRRRGGPPMNVLAWDWNAATFDSPSLAANSEAAVAQGRILGRTLGGVGLDPARIHLIGHSSGGLVVTSAAHLLATEQGRSVAQLTLLEPAEYYHSVIFRRLSAGSLAPIVENYWSPGPSAYGGEVALPGVRNVRIDGTARYAGLLCPLRSDHISLVHWYLKTVEDPRQAWGFNTSPLASGTPR